MDVGGIPGAIFAGMLADYTQSSAITCAIMIILGIPFVSGVVQSYLKSVGLNPF